jgi:hypothetical protein
LTLTDKLPILVRWLYTRQRCLRLARLLVLLGRVLAWYADRLAACVLAVSKPLILILAAALVWPAEAWETNRWNTNLSGNFNDPANWEFGLVPTSGDDAFFGRGASVAYAVNFPGAAIGFPPPVDTVGSLEVGSNDVTVQRGLTGFTGASFQTGSMVIEGRIRRQPQTAIPAAPIASRIADVGSGTAAEAEAPAPPAT